MPTARYFVGAGVVNGVLYVVRGNDATNTSVATNEAFTPTVAPPATLTLTPAAATNSVNTQHCVTATVEDVSGNPTPNVTVHFRRSTPLAPRPRM
jgi:hypothetical protein